MSIRTSNYQYLKIALQYYVSARNSSFCFFLPVAGNLFHHAIEMFLKFVLLSKFSPKQLKDEFSHNLEQLWRQYKKLQKDKVMNRYNSLIKKINKFEDLRYPNDKGYAIYIDRRKRNYSYSIGPEMVNVEEYRLNLEEIDEFISTILVGKVNADWVKASLIHGDGKSQYERENYHILYR